MKQSEKLDLILMRLYEYKYDGSFYSVDAILAQNKIDYSGNEPSVLAKRLEDDGLVKRAGNVSRDVQLTSYGVDYCESSSYSLTGTSIITNNYNLSISNSPNSILNNQSPNSILTISSNKDVTFLLEKLLGSIKHDSHISDEKKVELVSTTEVLINDSKSGNIKKENLSKLINISSQISSIGSFLFDILKSLLGV